jgi:hypothetical protein
VPELGALCNMQHPGFKLQDLMFSCKLLQKKTKSKYKNPTVLYKSRHNWPTHVLHFREPNPAPYDAAYA